MSMVPEIRRWEEAGMPVRSERRHLRVSPKMEWEEEKERHPVEDCPILRSRSPTQEVAPLPSRTARETKDDQTSNGPRRTMFSQSA
ncbi:hypothetical protein QJS10_CPB04g01340 [Acorus calamus]|uniref:Uncharacterized protein n=1 Tax=Acorus calamus TaxID=4465 RepID=A0AAV9EXH3_ACOCL|nr:hypothetical protein QJS10_CPB04g01340 [Acorus calamus]